MAEISTIARPYAVAAFNLAKEKKSLTEWSEMLEFLAQVSQDERMHTFINDSKVSDEDREKVLIKIAAKKLNAFGENLIKLLIENKRLNVLPEISAYVNPRQVTESEARSFLEANGYYPTDAEVKQFVGQISEDTAKANISAYIADNAAKNEGWTGINEKTTARNFYGNDVTPEQWKQLSQYVDYSTGEAYGNLLQDESKTKQQLSQALQKDDVASQYAKALLNFADLPSPVVKATGNLARDSSGNLLQIDDSGNIMYITGPQAGGVLTPDLLKNLQSGEINYINSMVNALNKGTLSPQDFYDDLSQRYTDEQISKIVTENQTNINRAIAAEKVGLLIS